jgi:cyclic dehypoxanthinyl futalosine synthase
MNSVNLTQKALAFDDLTLEEALELYQSYPLTALMALANAIRYKLHPDPEVGWIIDRNVNYTNVCVSGCKFCNFYRAKKHPEAYITTMEQYHEKVSEMLRLGGEQLLLQGGMHPELGLEFYTDLFKQLKQAFPTVKLHALGPPEIVHIAKQEAMSFEVVLRKLIEAGLDSLPGAGAEILADRVRTKLSPGKCSASEWLEVMRVAHQLGMLTSATMMFGHIETPEERVQHLLLLRELQAQKPESAPGFLSFIPWPFQSQNTVLERVYNIRGTTSPEEYIRLLAISRIVLHNIPNIQASWLTVGKPTAQICLHGGANDFGSVMIEENVVSVAGADHKFDAQGIQLAIKEAGFTPYQRNQRFERVGEL